MNDVRPDIREPSQKARAKKARRAVSLKLALYHQSLVDALSGDTTSFFERVMQEAQRDISEHRGAGPTPRQNI